jgi:Family of unknown function (DUF6295)
LCTYVTTTVELTGSAKGPQGWFPATSATVYYDHPVHAPAEHTLNVDVLNGGLGPSSRVALELDPTAARALAEAILAMLETVDP